MFEQKAQFVLHRQREQILECFGVKFCHWRNFGLLWTGYLRVISPTILFIPPPPPAFIFSHLETSKNSSCEQNTHRTWQAQCQAPLLWWYYSHWPNIKRRTQYKAETHAQKSNPNTQFCGPCFWRPSETLQQITCFGTSAEWHFSSACC